MSLTARVWAENILLIVYHLKFLPCAYSSHWGGRGETEKVRRIDPVHQHDDGIGFPPHQSQGGDIQESGGLGKIIIWKKWVFTKLTIDAKIFFPDNSQAEVAATAKATKLATEEEGKGDFKIEFPFFKTYIDTFPWW